MITLAKIFDNILLDHNKKPGKNMIVGLGTFSVIFNVDNLGYKITTEKYYNAIVNASQISNILHSKGVNVGRVYTVQTIVEEEGKPNTHTTLHRMHLTELFCKDDNQPDNDDINNYIVNLLKDYPKQPTKTYTDKYLKPANLIVQDIVPGVPCFDESFDLYNLFDITNYESLEKYIKHLNKNIKFFSNIKTEHYVKFILDALEICNIGLLLDNVTRKNYLYDKSKGFYFIDLDGDIHRNEKETKYDEVLDCTISNVIAQITAPSFLYNRQMRKDAVALELKLYDAYLKAIEKAAEEHREPLKKLAKTIDNLLRKDLSVYCKGLSKSDVDKFTTEFNNLSLKGIDHPIATIKNYYQVER